MTFTTVSVLSQIKSMIETLEHLFTLPLKIAEPTDSNHASTKHYVDLKLENLQSQLDALEN